MQPQPNKLSRSEQAKLNGAKSRGPKTADGHQKCAQSAQEASRRRAIALTFDCTLLPNESREIHDAIAQDEFAYHQPASPSEVQLVQELIDVNWRIKRIRFAQTNDLVANMESQRQRAASPQLSATMVANAEREGSMPNGAQLQFDRRVNILATHRAKILRDLERLRKRFPVAPGSQRVLETKHFSTEFQFEGPNDAPAPQPETPPLAYPTNPDTQTVPPAPEAKPETKTTDITAWAASALDFHPDAIQHQIMTEPNTRILVLAPRQTGKSTAAAVCVLHEAVHKANATILLASASGRQSGQILQKARQLARKLDIKLNGPPPQCEGFTLANGASVVALPDNEETIRCFSAPSLIVVDEAAFASDTVYKALEPMLTVSNGTLMLLSTPNGQLGYFYEQWHLPDSPWTKIFGTLEDCPRVNKEAIEGMRKSMAKADFEQEFECKFVASSGQFISVETFRKCLRDDFEPFCKDWDEGNLD